DAGDCEEAAGLCRQLLDRGGNESVTEAFEVAVACYCRLQRFSAARAMMENCDGRLSSVARSVFLGRVAFQELDRQAARLHAENALKAVDAATIANDRKRLAELLMRLGQHDGALPLLQGIARPGLYDDTTQMLLECARVAGHHGVILLTCR